MSIGSDVREFRQAFGLPVHSKPTLLTEEETKLHLDLLKEEFEELLLATGARDMKEIADALEDIIYVATGMAVHMGLPVSSLWREVHQSNMSKLDEKGEPLYHDGTEGPEGKVKKSHLFFEPRIAEILDAHGWDGE